MPVVVSDDFTGVSGATLNGRAANGGTWASFGTVNGLQINAANQVKAVSTSGGTLARIEVGQADHYSRAAVFQFTTPSRAAVAVRAVNNTTFIGLHAPNATSVQIFKRVGVSTDTQVALITGLTVAVGAILELRVTGQTVTAYLDGQLVGAAGGYAVTDTQFTGVTQVGIWGRTNDPIIDAFEGGTLETGAALPPASGRHAARSTPGALSVGYALAPAGSRHAGRATAGAVTVGAALAPARGRHASRAQQCAVATGSALAPARGRHASRAQPAALAPAGTLNPQRGRSPNRASAPALSVSFGLSPARGRHEARGTATAPAFDAGRVPIETKVPVETRVERATRP